MITSLQLSDLGCEGHPEVNPAWFGVSLTKSLSVQPLSSAHIWLRPKKCPVSCVAVRPLLKSGSRLKAPSSTEPKALCQTTTPSVKRLVEEFSKPSRSDSGNWAYPTCIPVRLHTQMFMYCSAGQ